MKTGMIIINYNDYNSTKKLIDNVREYKVIDRIIVVDNKSTDNSKINLKRLKIDKLKVIYNTENKGYSSAINIGCKALIEEFKECNIIISNADIIINKEDDLKELIKHLNKKDIGVVAPTILERGNLNHGWKNPTPFLEVLLNLPYIHRLIRKKYLYYKDEHYKNETSVVDVVSGCFFLIKSKVLEKINYFDENLFLYYEENVLSKKLEDINKKSIIVNNTMVVHNHSVTIDKNINKIKKYKIQKESQYYFEKNYNDANIIECFFLKVTSYITKLILYIYYFLRDLIK